MKIDRLIGILAILLQRDQVSAPELAEKFEVSRRTINRDIEHLCKAGIPLVTNRGRGGGIAIMEGYKIDKTILTSSELEAIRAGLQGLDSVSESKKYQQLMDKLCVNPNTVLASNHHIRIDLTSWYRSTLAPKITILQQAIANHQLVRFDYCAPGGETSRQMEPYLLVFQWSHWYIWGFCCKRNDYRLFKLNRMMNLTILAELFVPRTVPKYEVYSKPADLALVEVWAVFEPSMKWRLIEEYGNDSFTIRTDGRLNFCFHFKDQEHVLSWLLSFGTAVELMAPSDLRRKLKDRIKEIYQIYMPE